MSEYRGYKRGDETTSIDGEIEYREEFLERSFLKDINKEYNKLISQEFQRRQNDLDLPLIVSRFY